MWTLFLWIEPQYTHGALAHANVARDANREIELAADFNAQKYPIGHLTLHALHQSKERL